MAMHPVIDNLDRCTMALQSLAEGQSSSLTVVLELLLEQLEDAMGRPRPSCVRARARAPPSRGLRPALRRGACSRSSHAPGRHPRLGPQKTPRRSLGHPAPSAFAPAPQEAVGRPVLPQPGGPWPLLHAMPSFPRAWPCMDTAHAARDLRGIALRRAYGACLCCQPEQTCDARGEGDDRTLPALPSQADPQRHTAQAHLRSAEQPLLQEFLRQHLALQCEAATVHSAARRLDLHCPDLWSRLRHLLRSLQSAGAGRQPDALGSCSCVSLVSVCSRCGTGPLMTASRLRRRSDGPGCVVPGHAHGVPTPCWPPQVDARRSFIVTQALHCW
jgi:hypothetical protein